PKNVSPDGTVKIPSGHHGVLNRISLLDANGNEVTLMCVGSEEPVMQRHYIAIAGLSGLCLNHVDKPTANRVSQFAGVAPVSSMSTWITADGKVPIMIPNAANFALLADSNTFVMRHATEGLRFMVDLTSKRWKAVHLDPTLASDLCDGGLNHRFMSRALAIPGLGMVHILSDIGMPAKAVSFRRVGDDVFATHLATFETGGDICIGTPVGSSSDKVTLFSVRPGDDDHHIARVYTGETADFVPKIARQFPHRAPVVSGKDIAIA
ncbi:MAG: hypothetical protein NT003_00850, partial [Candidatus Magasanikbacteria bacterium]|nr:hypothetical protein [Candidatus Magasanikbacteria bacterium]